MDKAKHLIQILTLRQENEQYIIKVVGSIFAEDKNQVVFNPSIKNSKNGHWTWHKDGKIHLKHNDQIIFSKNSIPLSKFKGKRQFLFSGSTKDANIHID